MAFLNLSINMEVHTFLYYYVVISRDAMSFLCERLGLSFFFQHPNLEARIFCLIIFLRGEKFL